MPGYSFNSGGLKLNPVITAAPVDPIEIAIKQAQLYNLQQDPKLRERALTLQQLGLEHNQANDDAMRRIQEAGLLEQTRHNTATEKVATGQLGEETRHNITGEGLTARGQDITAADSANQQKSAVTVALIHTMLGNLDPKDQDHHIAAETLSQLGYPQLKNALGTTEPTALEKQGSLAIDMLTKNKNGPVDPNQPRKFTLLDALRFGK